jgi:quinol-cytochrome oxidoreductase complex cytochrome b subunit
MDNQKTSNAKKISSIIKAVSITLIFGAIYLIVARWQGDPLEPWMSYYHSLITQTTLGYDWYLPKKAIYYGINSIQMILVWLFVLFEIIV